MPTKLVTIKSTRKENFGEPVEVNAYYWTPDNEPLGVIIGHFAPFTGKYGHARMMYEAQKYGINKFVVVMPPSKGDLDDNRNLFTNEQRVKIVEEGCKELGIDIIDCWIDEQKVPASILGLIQRRFPSNRIVICCGPDREKTYSKIALPFDENNKPTLDPEDPNFRKQEMIVCTDRGEQEVSGTAVRGLLKSGDKESFKKMTGYSDKMWNMMRNFIRKNGVVEIEESFSESFMALKTVINEEMQATKREGIKHLYNPGNSQQLSAQDFIDVVRWLKKQNGKLVDRVNVSYSEKCDGAAFRFGLDENGKFFVEQSNSGPIFDRSEFENRNKERFGYITRLGKEWGNVLDRFRSDKNIQKVLRKYTTDSGIKIIGEIYINALGAKGKKNDTLRFVGTEYYKSKIGSFCSIILINGMDGEGNELKNFDEIREAFKNISTDKILFDDCNYTDRFGDVDLNDEIDELEEIIKKIEEDCGEDIMSILNSKDRTKSAVQKRKEVKTIIEEYQGKFNDKLKALFAKTDGKWGPEREGIVLKLANERLLKITSDTFKKFKASQDNSHAQWLFGPADEEQTNESFYKEAYRFLRR